LRHLARRRLSIADELGGNIQQFLPTAKHSNRSVVACCYSSDKNIQAPNTLLVGGKKKYTNACSFARDKNFVPFFRKEKDGWEFIGDYRVREWTENPQIIAAEKIRGEDNDVRIVLYLESAEEVALKASAKTEVERTQNSEGLVLEAATPPDEAELEMSKAEIGQQNTSTPRQPDPEKRALVEKAAVKCVLAHFDDYEIIDRQFDYVGWDFEATKDELKLFLEVKGVSGNDLRVELTPNEYAKMKQNSSQYRVCVVLNALEERRILHVLQYFPERSCLVSESGVSVRIQEAVAARLFAC